MPCVDNPVFCQSYIFNSPIDLELKLSSYGISCECLVLEKGFFKAFLSIKSNGLLTK